MTTIIHKLRVGSFLLVHNSIIHAIGSNIHFPIVLGTPVVVYTSLLITRGFSVQVKDKPVH